MTILFSRRSTVVLAIVMSFLFTRPVAVAEAVPAAWTRVRLELSTELRRAFRAIAAGELDQTKHQRRVCEVLWSLDLAANRQSPRYFQDCGPVVTEALKDALDGDFGADPRVARRVAEFVAKVAEEAQLRPGTIWSELAAPEFAERRVLLRILRVASALGFGMLAASAAYEHAWLMTGLISVVGVAAVVGVGDYDEALRPVNRVRPALLECEARLWRRVPQEPSPPGAAGEA